MQTRQSASLVLAHTRTQTLVAERERQDENEHGHERERRGERRGEGCRGWIRAVDGALGLGSSGQCAARENVC